MKYTFLNVNISKSEQVRLKFFASTPFDAIIGLEAIKKHRLLDRFPSYIGLDIDTSTDQHLPSLTLCLPCKGSTLRQTLKRKPPTTTVHTNNIVTVIVESM